MRPFLLALLLLGCAKPPIPPPQPGPDAGACVIHWMATCNNALANGWGYAYPGGCTEAKAEEHCR